MVTSKPTKDGGKDQSGKPKEVNAEELTKLAKDGDLMDLVSVLQEQDRRAEEKVAQMVDKSEEKDYLDGGEGMGGEDEDQYDDSEVQGSQAEPKLEHEQALENVLLDERNLPTDQKVGRINQMYVRLKRGWLFIALWVLVNVLNNDLREARSKNPKKENPFSAICDHEDLHPDLKGPTLRRWVSAAATNQELLGDGLNTESLDYSHLREISKIHTKEGRLMVAKAVIEGSLKVKAAVELVRLEIRKGKADVSPESDFCGLAQSVMEGLDNPLSLRDDEDVSSVVLDETQLRQEFNFREQASIYSKAEKVKTQMLKEKSVTEERLETVQQSITFLENVMNAFNGVSVDGGNQD
ncbi:MAG: hypothetical protein ACLQPD_26940 [Desulfomonilaceae bacterium]